MRILLLGEYSSLHKNLKEGLVEIGNDVDLASTGDYWKKIGGSNLLLYNKSHGGVRKLYDQNFEPLIHVKRFSGYDVVQYITPYLFPKMINGIMIKEISKRNAFTSLLSCGYDYAYYMAYQNNAFRYCSLDIDKRRRDFFDMNTIRGRICVRDFYTATKNADVIIPMSYDYSVGYENHSKLHSVVPQPININKIHYKENVCRGKIRIFHGINKANYILKGTDLILNALRIIKERYPNDVEIIINEPMPYDQYLNAMESANIVIDQCYSYGYGMNACIALAQGKIVLSGNTPENRAALGIDSCPIVGIEPSVDSIYKAIEYVLENKNKFLELGYQGRKYVETIHDCKVIARKYLLAWREAKNKERSRNASN